MTETVTSVIAAIPPSALPIVVVILGLAYLYFKFSRVEKDREFTKHQRDKDSQAIHDDILKLKFTTSNLQGMVDLHGDKLESIDRQLSLVNQELAKLNTQVEHLANSLSQLNGIIIEQLKTKN